MPEPVKIDGWHEWSNHVLAELIRLNACYDKLHEEVVNARVEIVILKVKAGIWGAVGGAIPVAVMIGFILLRGL